MHINAISKLQIEDSTNIHSLKMKSNLHKNLQMGMGSVADPQTRPSPRYLVEFGCSRSNRMGMGINLGNSGAVSLAIGVWLTPKNTPLQQMLSYRMWSFWSNSTSVLKENRLKILIHRAPPFKVTQGHRNRHGSIGYLWLPINVP